MQVREEELRYRLRVKSARPRGIVPVEVGEQITPEGDSPPSPHIPITAKDPDLGSSGEAADLLSCVGD